MSSSSGCRHSHDQINPLEFAQPMSKPRPTSQSPARLTSEARSDLISTDREDTVRRALTGRRVRGWPPCAPRVLGEAPVAPSPVACCRSRKAVRLGSCGRGLGASRVFPRRNRIAGRSDRSRVSLAISIGYLAVPRGLTKQNGFNGLERGLGENAPIDIQDVSDGLPKPSRSGTADRPDLIVDPGDLPATARELRDLLAASGRFFDRGVPIKIVPDANGRAPTATELTPNKVVMAAHDFCRPVREQGDELVRVTLPQRVGRMYLDLAGEWNLQPLAGITTAPVLAPDGTVRTAEGYDPMTQLWCARVPILTMPDQPSRKEAEAALRLLRERFRTFPFADAPRKKDARLDLEVLDVDQPAGLDESTFLVALLTAVCRPNLPLAPGFLVRAPEISGAGTGKGLLVRSICAIAFGVQPRAFTKGADRQELDKRLTSDLIEAAPMLFLDNINGSMKATGTRVRELVGGPVLGDRPRRAPAPGG